MKLYEFTYVDNQNLSEQELLHRVGEFLFSESVLQSWAPGYEFWPCRKVEQLANDEKNYYFEVTGKYLSADSVGFDEEILETAPTSSGRPAAAAALDLNP